MKEHVESTEAGAILYDKSLINHMSDGCFEPGAWPACKPVEGVLRSGGRGTTIIVANGEREFVLRHYRRGGLVGRVNHDRYLWRGRDRTRSFAEWRLLAWMRRRGLPVPRPAAARYRRHGMVYRADLLTVHEPGIRPLAARLLEETDGRFWRGIGRGVRRFHDACVCHADLNAYNLQVDERDRVFLLDFDRGRIRKPGAWQRDNLARLERSLDKVARLEPRLSWDKRHWRQLLAGYAEDPAAGD